ncbi:pilus assembly protein [Sphingomonas rosea]|uniref:Pilus assembly protein n=1 Tax=Sphingomonas rosea TaxID=335605 RepID=A0ABP7TIM5_9SPHN
MLRLLKKLRRNERGNVLIVVAAAIPLLVGSAGLAVDTIQWALWKRQLQRAADSAAMAGVYTRIAANGDASGVSAAVTQDLALNQKTGITLKNAAEIDTSMADTSTMTNQVKVTLAIQKPLTFSSVYMTFTPTITATSTAAGVITSGGEFCVIGLDRRTSITGINIQGSTTLDMGKCSLIANSANPTAAATNTGVGSTVIAKRLAAAGGIAKSAKWTVEGYDPYSPPIADPYASAPMPSSSSQCTRTISIPKQQNQYPLDRSTIDKKGDIVCVTGGMDIGGKLTLGSATYVLTDGGDLNMNSSGTELNCTSCSFLLTNFSDPTASGNIKLTGGKINVTAPSADGETYKGIAFYQDRRATDGSNANFQNRVTGNDGSMVTGAIYTPNRFLLYNGASSVTSGPACVQIIGKRVEFSGNSKIKLSSECTGSGLNPIGSNAVKVRLVA